MKTRLATQCWRSVVLLLFALLLAPWPAQAQRIPGLGQLGDIPGLTPYQQANANVIDALCPRLVGASFLGQPSPTGDLTTECTRLKGSASQLQGQQGGLAFGLGLSNPELANVLGIWTHDQATENGRAAIEIGARQSRAIAGRLTALRLGARGVAVSGLSGPGEARSFAWSEIAGPGAGASADGGQARSFGAFVNATYGWGDKDETSREIGFDYDIAAVVAGLDYRITENFILGVAFNYAHTSADFRSNLGDTDTNSYGGILYSTYYVSNFYVDGYFGFNWNAYSSQRHIAYSAGSNPGAQSVGFALDRTAKADPSGQAYSLGVGAGYDFPVGAWTFTPLARADFIGLNVDSYTETGAAGLNLKVAAQKQTSFVIGLGGQVGYAISLPFGVLVPQVRAEWRHEFLNDSRSIRARYAADPFPTPTGFVIPTDNPTRDYAAFSVGVSSVFKGGWQAFLNYDALFGLRSITSNQITGGVRFDF